MAKFFINGKFISPEEATVSIFDRGFLYGDGVFESLRTYNRRPFLLEEHLKRLLTGAKAIKIRSPYSLGQLKLAILKTVAINKYKESYIKIIITRGTAKGHGLDFANVSSQPSVIIMVEELREPPKNLYTKGWKAIISTIHKPENPTSRIKSLCYLDNAMAKAEARKNGADEALLLDAKGHLVEGSASNLFVVKMGTIYTPPAEAPILCGLTRKLVIQLAKQSAIKVQEKILDPKELYNCDECFVTSSGFGIVPITSIWNRKIGNGQAGSLTQQLIIRYQAETHK